MAPELIRAIAYNTTIHTTLHGNPKATPGTHAALKTWNHTAQMQRGKSQIIGCLAHALKKVSSKTTSNQVSFQKENISCKKGCVSVSVFVNTFITLVNRDAIM